MESPTINDRSQITGQRQVIKAFIAGIIVLFLSTMLSRGVIAWISATTSARRFRFYTSDFERLRSFMATLPKLVKQEEPTGYFFGSSLIAFGFSPRLFDEFLQTKAANLRTYNAGMIGATPDVTLLMIKRLQESYSDN